ncbi:hypothetical protein, partial [Rhodospirillum rubrum]|uniref:hypothetical protein n=1 Tax=Rhodospirillum rubrum TaxID=1085 RepID=UPI0028ADD8C8
RSLGRATVLVVKIAGLGHGGDCARDPRPGKPKNAEIIPCIPRSAVALSAAFEGPGLFPDFSRKIVPP